MMMMVMMMVTNDGDDDDGDEVMMQCDCMLDTCYSNVTVSSPGMPTNRLNAVPYAHDSDAVQMIHKLQVANLCCEKCCHGSICCSTIHSCSLH